MKLSNPLPQPLAKECAKATKIFQSFVDSGNNGLDGVIPRSVLEQAKGFAIFTIVKAGFIFSARAGSGIVIAKLDDGTWSAPSAIGTAGVGFGGQAGAEVTDFLVVLNSKSAIRSFMAAGSITLGGNMSIALGPLGRNGEATGAVNTNGKVAAMYSYSKTRGLFGGISLEGSVIVERQDANALAYNSPVTARMLLGGVVDRPDWAIPLIKTLEACTGLPNGRTWIEDRRPTHSRQYSFGDGVGAVGGPPRRSGSLSSTPSFLRKKRADFPPASWGTPSNSGSFFTSPSTESTSRQPQSSGSRSEGTGFQTHFDSTYDDVATFTSKARIHDDTVPPYDEDPLVIAAEHQNQKKPARSLSLHDPRGTSSNYKASTFNPRDRDTHLVSLEDEDPFITPPSQSPLGRNGNTQPIPDWTSQLGEGVGRAIALYKFDGVEAGDLSFDKGDVIAVLKKSDSTDDWWTGKCGGREGIFPANFVELA